MTPPTSTPTESPDNARRELPDVDLRSPGLAALLAWLIPGAGHLYQRRFAKAALFFVCIMGTFFFGLAMGGGRVVYASFSSGNVRWQYAFQLGVGLPALPALAQHQLAKGGEPWGDWMRPPNPLRGPQEPDELAEWHEDYHGFFELGTLYTMVAGLMNILAIYDAGFGPFWPVPEESKGDDADDKKKRKGKSSGTGPPDDQGETSDIEEAHA